MSDYLAAQKAISFAYDSTLEVVTDQEQKLGLASSGTLTLNRPDKLHATRTGGFANVEMVYDGKTLTMLGKNANAFAKAEEPGTIDQLVDVLRKKYDRPVPAADLLMSDPYKELVPLVVDAKDLGSGVIRGSCTNVSGLFVEPRLRAMMDIRAHPISLADRPEAAIWVTRLRMRRRDRSPSPVPLADLGGTQ